MPSEWLKNTIWFVPHGVGCYSCFGAIHDSDLSTEFRDAASALALLAVRMSRENWECGREKFPFSQKSKLLEEGVVVIEFYGGETGWVVEYWPGGSQDNSLGASHLTRPEAAVAIIALMMANPPLYDEPKTEGEPGVV